MITATSTSDLDSKTFVLTPTLTTNNEIIWTSSGTCSENGLCANNATTDESSTTDTGTTDTGTTDTGTTDTGTTDTGITYTTDQQVTLDNCSTGNSGKYCVYYVNSAGPQCGCITNTNTDCATTTIGCCTLIIKGSPVYIGGIANKSFCVLIP